MKRKQELSRIIGCNFFSFPFSSWVGILVAQKSFFSFPSSRPQLAAATDVEQWIWFECPCPISLHAKYTHDIWYLTNFSKSIFCPNLTNIFFSVAVNLLNALKWTALTSLLLVWVALSSFPGHQILQLSLSTKLLSLAIYTHTKTASDCLLVCFYLFLSIIFYPYGLVGQGSGHISAIRNKLLNL